MRKSIKKFLAAVLVIILVVGTVPFGMFPNVNLGIEASAASGVSKTLDFDWSLIKKIGPQPKGSQTCSCYSLAYCRTILDGKIHSYSEYNKYGAQQKKVDALWSKGSYVSKKPKSAQEAYRLVYDSINNGKPAILKIAGKGIKTQHYVAVVGYVDVKDPNNLSASNFVAINPGSYFFGKLYNIGKNGCYAHPSFQCVLDKDVNTKTNLVLSLQNAGDISNSSVTISAKFNIKASVQRVSYAISTKESEIKGVDFSKTNNHNKTSTRDVLRYKDYTSKPQSINSCSIKVNKILNADLKPATKYYYAILIQSGSKWYYSNAGSFTTTNVKPSSATPVVNEKSKNIGINDTAEISWKAASGATSYAVNLYNSSNTVVYSKDNIQGTVLSFPKECFASSGKYYVSLTAKNSAGSTECSERPEITVHDDVTVTFYDTVSEEVISECKVVYGHDANLPADPSQIGYTFKRWEGQYQSVTENTTVNTVYEANTYNVSFVDGLTGEILKTEKVKYNSTASAPGVPIHDGYEFKDWDKDFSKITNDTTVTAVYKWYSEYYPVVTSITSLERTESGDGYDYEIRIIGNSEAVSDKAIKGRLIIALKTEDGYMFAKTDSAAFSIRSDGSATVSGFIDSDKTATTVEVYTVQNYDCAGILATPVTQAVNNSGCWSGWIEYTDGVPVTEGLDGIIAVETKEVTYYRESNKETTTSYATSLAGYTQNGYQKVKVSSGTEYYVKSWPSDYYTSDSNYKKYNITPKTNSETSTQKIEVGAEETYGYVYWHWCEGITSGASNRYISTEKGTFSGRTYKAFHSFVSTSKYSNCTGSVSELIKKTNSACKGSYYWWGFNSKQYKSPAVIKERTYTIYNKLYNYYRWTDWSGWSETPATASDNKHVETKTVKYYRYKIDGSIPEPQATDVQKYSSLNVKTLDANKYANREAAIFIYKYTSPSDFTNEYIGKTVIDSNGNITLNNITLREAPSVESGDYIIAAAVEGYSGTVEIGRIEAPKKQCVVKFYDTDNETVIYETTVDQGDSVNPPEIDGLNIPEGYYFVRWSQSTVNVQDNLCVYPETDVKECVVVFIDWGKQEYEMKTVHYGDEIIIPPAESIEGVIVSWDLSGLRENNGRYYVVGNTVVTTIYEEKTITVSFVDPDKITITEDTDALDLAIDSEDLISTEQVPYNVPVPTPAEIDDSPEYIFYGWKSIKTGEYLVDMEVSMDDIYYPVYEFTDDADMPIASVSSGEYDSDQTVTLECETENSVIYYTTDGSNPTTSSTAIEYTGPITISKSCSLKFYSMAFHMNDSRVVVENYAINKPTTSVKYYIVNVYNDFEMGEYAYYQLLAREGSRIDLSEFKNMTGYIYCGTYYDEEYIDEFYEEYDTVEESMDLFVKYNPIMFTATFIDSYGEVISESTVEYGTSAETPEPPIREGYIFIGWDSNDYCNMTKDGTFTAKYIPESEYATVAFSRKSFSGIIGGHRKLSAVVSPVELSSTTSLSWISSDPTVAEVDYNGDVSFVGVGKAVITVIVDSTGEYATCTITVNADPELKITLGDNSSLGKDSDGNIRGIKNEQNAVAQIKEQFVNESLIFVDKNGTQLADTDLVGTGTVIQLYNGTEIIDQTVVVMTGDVNGDGKVNNRDVSFITRYLVDKETPGNEYEMIALDANGDGYVNNRDAAMISRYLVGKETF